MNARKIFLRFSEPIRSSSLDPGEISIQTVADVLNAANGAADAAVALTTSSTSSSNGLGLTVDISDNDFNNLKLAALTTLSRDTTFLIHTVDAFTDMIVPPNAAKAIIDGVALKAEKFAADKDSPTLNSFTIDMDSGELLLTFSEPADASTVDVTKIQVGIVWVMVAAACVIFCV